MDAMSVTNSVRAADRENHNVNSSGFWLRSHLAAHPSAYWSPNIKQNTMKLMTWRVINGTRPLAVQMVCRNFLHPVLALTLFLSVGNLNDYCSFSSDRHVFLHCSPNSAKHSVKSFLVDDVVLEVVLAFPNRFLIFCCCGHAFSKGFVFCAEGRRLFSG